jgi:hypothetical protein
VTAALSPSNLTIVQGAIHDQWSKDDPIWAQIMGEAEVGNAVAVSFRESGYKRQGSSSICFDGEYRAIAKGKTMARRVVLPNTTCWSAGS